MHWKYHRTRSETLDRIIERKIKANRRILEPVVVEQTKNQTV